MQNTPPVQKSTQPTPTPQSENIPPTTQTPQPTPKKKKPWLLISLVIFLLSSTGVLGYKYYQVKQQLDKEQSTLLPSPKAIVSNPSSESSSSPLVDTTTNMIDVTADWKTYTNTEYSYSIQYPKSFNTQILSAGAGEKEAPPNARNLFIYNLDLQEPYLNRYINLELFQLEPSYGSEWTKTQATLGSKNATKLTNSNQVSNFDIYIVQLKDKGFLEIYASNYKEKVSTVSQILSTLQFTD